MRISFLLLMLAFAGALSAQQQISVSLGSQVITDGQADVDLGDVPTGSQQSIMFTIENNGSAALTLNGTPSLVAVTAGANANVSVSTQPSVTIAAGQTTTFTVDVTAQASGDFDFNVSIPSNASLGTFDFTVIGNGATVAEIVISRNGTLLMDGQVDLVGSVGSGNSVDLTYTIENTGLIDLNIMSQITVTSQVNCTVTVTQQPNLIILPGDTTQMTLHVTANSDAAFSFEVNVANDTDNTSADFEGSGNVVLLGPHHHHDDVEVNCSTSEGSSALLVFSAMFVAFAFFMKRRTLV
jgi:hypothetical protein